MTSKHIRQYASASSNLRVIIAIFADELTHRVSFVILLFRDWFVNIYDGTLIKNRKAYSTKVTGMENLDPHFK